MINKESARHQAYNLNTLQISIYVSAQACSKKCNVEKECIRGQFSRGHFIRGQYRIALHWYIITQYSKEQW